MSDSEQDVEELPLPDDYEKFFDSRFIKAVDLGGADRTLKIERAKLEMLPSMKQLGEKELRGSLVFEGRKKILGLNRTNCECMVAMFGRNPKAWAGKRVTIFPTTVKMKKSRTEPPTDEPCIRIRGSPDLERDINFELRLPFKKPKPITLKRIADAPAKPPAKP